MSSKTDSPAGYLSESRRPIYSALLVLPYAVVYEIGVIALQAGLTGEPVREINGGDYLIRRVLSPIVGHFAFASFLVLCAAYFVWQYEKGGRRPFAFDRGTLLLTFVESLGFALILCLISRYLWNLSARVERAAGTLPVAASGGGFGDQLKMLILFCGAGVYEELVFRVFLLGILAMFFRHLLRWEKSSADVAAVIIGALLFSLFHYLPPGGDPWSFRTFVIRAFAGVYFAAIYKARSYGIAVSAHALYDIIVGLDW
ncbi:MAG: CPBP family intramembrane metalloprotease [Planctomycetota bacterium]|nr:CPBP family intramembrane metalloprotease [Planctomycetota bacterium]